jgi:hypothetical protein
LTARPTTPVPLGAGPHPDEEALVRFLRTPEAVRRRCNRVLDLGERGQLGYFTVHHEHMGTIADLVAQVTREHYPTLDIPVHGRLTQLDAGGVRRTAELRSALGSLSPEDRARSLVDLIVVSVLLEGDAGLGSATPGATPSGSWRYREAAGAGREAATYTRSQGLAIASLRMFLAGGFSSEPRRPLSADATGLQAVTLERL